MAVGKNKVAVQRLQEVVANLDLRTTSDASTA